MSGQGYNMDIFYIERTMATISSQVQKAYKAVISDYKDKVKSEDLDHRYIERFLLSLEPKQKVLDIGCGTGGVSNEMAENHQLKVTAIDISEDMVSLAKKLHPRLRVLRMDMLKLKFPSNSFDAVFANYSLIHIPDTEIDISLKQIGKVLKRGGLLYLALQEPIRAMDRDGFYPLVYRPEVKMFINLITEREMKKALKDAGFKVEWLERRAPNKKFEFPFNKLFIVARKVKKGGR